MMMMKKSQNKITTTTQKTSDAQFAILLNGRLACTVYIHLFSLTRKLYTDCLFLLLCFCILFDFVSFFGFFFVSFRLLHTHTRTSYTPSVFFKILNASYTHQIKWLNEQFFLFKMTHTKKSINYVHLFAV